MQMPWLSCRGICIFRHRNGRKPFELAAVSYYPMRKGKREEPELRKEAWRMGLAPCSRGFRLPLRESRDAEWRHLVQTCGKTVCE